MSVVTSGHDVADARLHRVVTALAADGLQVEVLGLGDPSGAPQAAVRVRTRPRSGGVARLLRAATLPWRATGQVLVALDPDSALGCVPVRALRRRGLVVDVHEDYAALLADRTWAHGPVGALARALVAVSVRACAGADATVVVADHLPPARARRRVVQPNLPDPNLVPPAGACDPRPRALYVGDLRRSRGLFAMLDALTAAPEWSLDLVGPVAPEDRDELRERLHDDLADRVRLHGRLPPADAWQLARGAWVGLCLLADTPAFRHAVPTKVLEYRSSGLPVVATDLPATRSALAGAGQLVPTDRAGAATAEVLRGWSLDRAGYERVREAAAASAEREVPEPYAPFVGAVRSVLQDVGRGRSARRAASAP